MTESLDQTETIGLETWNTMAVVNQGRLLYKRCLTRAEFVINCAVALIRSVSFNYEAAGWREIGVAPPEPVDALNQPVCVTIVASDHGSPLVPT